MKNISKDIKSSEITDALSTLKKKKEDAGIIPADGKKIVVTDGRQDFSGKSLKIIKGLFKNGKNYSYKAGTKWEDIDVFGKKNIRFKESDFK